MAIYSSCKRREKIVLHLLLLKLSNREGMLTRRIQLDTKRQSLKNFFYDEACQLCLEKEFCIRIPKQLAFFFASINVVETVENCNRQL